MTTKFLLSPTETKLAKALGEEAMVSPIPELKGADILIYSESGLVGVQRKEVPHDFIASFTDGRMARAIALLKQNCTFQRVVGEKRFRYYPDTTVDMGRYRGGKPIKTGFTKKHVKGMVNDIEFVHGVMVDWTDDLEDTVLYLRSMRSFLAGKTHTGLYSRPSAKGLWNIPTSKDIELWLLQSFPGIGPATADAIIQHFGGEVPLKWTCTFEELCKVKNVTVSKARELWEYLPSSPPLPAPRKPEGTFINRMTDYEKLGRIQDEFNGLRSKLRRKDA